ncbi:hypothetical protein ABEW34_21605 [Paenibacillus algorifonticola]|uniref:hypothetical protein n=1 Tax=Paenibacillus algorifonticola TaxID=684063 RepID=UPI003D2AC687
MIELTMKEVADRLDMAESSLRRWLPLMEQYGYVFQRKENQRRQLTERDVAVLADIKLISQVKSLEETCLLLIRPSNLESHVDPSAKKEFEAMLEQLLDVIYWQGAAVAVEQLRRQWLKIMDTEELG